MHHAANRDVPHGLHCLPSRTSAALAAHFLSGGHARGSYDVTFSYNDAIHRIIEPMQRHWSRAEQHQLLKTHILFSQLGDDELHECLAHSHIEQYAAKHEIFAKGSAGESMMAVLRGSVKVSAWPPDGREIVFNTMDAGNIFGEIALLDGRERSADATAPTDRKILVLYRRDSCRFCGVTQISALCCSKCCASGCDAPASRSRTRRL